MNVKILAAILLAGLVLFGCTQNAPQATAGPTTAATVQVTAAPTTAETARATIAPTSAASAQAGTPSATQSQSAVQEINLEAKQFEFIPNTITVKKGIPVKITIKSDDVTHGFSLPDFNVQTQESPGQPGVVQFTPDKAGTFSFACNVVCGAGHGSMVGTLIVTNN